MLFHVEHQINGGSDNVLGLVPAWNLSDGSDQHNWSEKFVSSINRKHPRFLNKINFQLITKIFCSVVYSFTGKLTLRHSS